MLHAWRIAAKQARYLAELCADTPEGRFFVDELKRAQDEIGQWHDILKLHERAVELFGDVHDSPLVSMLQNISRARFKRASAALASALSALSTSQKETASPAAPQSAGHRELAAQSAAA
jgi:CHAD domain-containing protein